MPEDEDEIAYGVEFVFSVEEDGKLLSVDVWHPVDTWEPPVTSAMRAAIIAWCQSTKG
jgi:hypothetical protein